MSLSGSGLAYKDTIHHSLGPSIVSISSRRCCWYQQMSEILDPELTTSFGRGQAG